MVKSSLSISNSSNQPIKQTRTYQLKTWNSSNRRLLRSRLSNSQGTTTASSITSRKTTKTSINYRCRVPLVTKATTKTYLPS